ncbi:ABC-2 type transport system ATP-binding protein [Nocardioides luteus]|uniref:Xaa-Pro dipeptidyl-peptidase C-terminal domain-containing protein n=1 Tax=Nocardioides luteus TaxID=1844 RepID=A0ABQ5T295_9ACTN|nr:CocE/NonD family hydrolase [Nocardioides luteus]MDR7310283.1 ABC-2 type transport system ATP-binding protein [Nocardioides luteus]GGR53725.1 hypothetical protein GCM10010197_20220 [Nocardioides luteus]GLJ69938.1 hypothetical protein GCM10017579_39740 [Nocardioides luteus]
MRRVLARFLGLALALPLASLAVVPDAAAAAPYVVRTLHFKVEVGPSAATRTCDVVGDLYLPRTASAKRRVPAIMTTNGFGGSKDDQAGIGRSAASRGYAVLAYSGLGFGGSGCKITLDDPDWDGKAASQLVSYLGGAPGIAFTDTRHTEPAPRLTAVKVDRTAHDGRRRAHDPRVGMIGGSYGGQVQFAAASVDPRIDTIVPMITWNDLSYSLGPNNTDLRTGVTSRTPGATKLAWGLSFAALGTVEGVRHAPEDPSRLLGCPNFANFVCGALVTGGATGYFDPASVAKLRHASVADYVERIRIPTLLLQGQADTLFNLNEAAATYRALRAQGTPVKMVWHSWGHSGPAAPGEFDSSNPDPATQYEARRVFDWFARYLKDEQVSTGPAFAWFRDWVDYRGIATKAYGTSSTFPVGSPRSYYLSGTSLIATSKRPKAATRSFVVPAAGLPTRIDPMDVFGDLLDLPLPEADLPGTSATWTGGRLVKPVDVVGAPRLALEVDAPAARGGAPATDLVLFVRLQDVGPDGVASDIEHLTAPVRVPDATKRFAVTLPAVVHRFAPGHKVRLVVAGGSLNYRGGLVPGPVSITTGSTAQALHLPVTGCSC